MAVKAAELVLQLVEASSEIGGEHKQEAIILAHEDIAEMRALHAYLHETSHWEDYAAEDTLRSFLGILYLVEMDEQGTELPQVEHLPSLLHFGRELKPEQFQTLPETEDVHQLLEELWHQHCARNGIQVASESLFKPFRRYTDMNMTPSRPSRAPANDLDLSPACSAGPVTAEGANEKLVAELPKLFDFVEMVWKAEFLRALPSRIKGNAISKVLAFVRQCGYDEVEKAIVSIYTGPFYEDSKWEEDEDDHWSFDFTAKEAVLILQAIKSVSPLFRRLILQRPPKSIMPHWMACMTSTEHVRLWLARVDLNIYYDQDLSYGQLCTEAGRKAELEVLKFSFCCERAPSPLQRQLRLGTLNCLWNNQYDIVHNFRPEDFRQEACGSKLWAGLKKLGHPTVVRQEKKADVDVYFKPVAHRYTRLLQYEDKRKVDWLFWEMGLPSEEELAPHRPGSSTVQESKPRSSACGFM